MLIDLFQLEGGGALMRYVACIMVFFCAGHVHCLILCKGPPFYFDICSKPAFVPASLQGVHFFVIPPISLQQRHVTYIIPGCYAQETMTSHLE